MNLYNPFKVSCTWPPGAGIANVLIKGVIKVQSFSLNSLLYLSAVLLHLPHPSILLLNVLISSKKSSLPVLLSVTPHGNARLSPWCGGEQKSQDAH